MRDNNRLKRKEGETIEEYQFRLSMMKLIEGEDIDWEDIKELLNSNEHRDTLRRKGKGMEMAKDIYEKKIQELEETHKKEIREIKNKINEEIESKRIREIDKKLEKFEKEKIKLRDRKNEVNRQIRDLARLESLVELTKESVLELNKTVPLIGDFLDLDKSSDRDGIILLSDIHIGASCDNILDQYNPNITKEKLKYYISRAIDEIKREGINKVYFLVAGDILSGLIHTTTRFHNRLNITEQIVYASELLAEAINEVSKYSSVMVGILAGNHDRIVAEKDKHLEEENFVEIVREMVGLRLANNKRVVIMTPQDTTLISLDIRGYKIAVVHGHLDRKRSMDRLIEMYRDVYYYILMGHYHKFEISQHNHTTIICNGSFAGEDYAKNNRLYNKAEQLFMTIDDFGIGKITPINLNNYKK